jgi:hypothetical protein
MNKIVTIKVFKSALVFFGLMLLLLPSRLAFGQTAASYGFSATAGTYTYLSGGTSVTSILTDDGTSAAIPIGFTFNYCGTGYTQLLACSNGWLTFNTSVTSSTWTNTLANLATIKPALMPWFDDMEGYFGTASYVTTGSVGSRVFTFEFKNWDIDWSYDYNISIQVKLYEATGVIQYIYKRESGYYGGYETGTIGIGDGAATPTYLTLNGTGASPAASSTTFNTALYGRPANGQVYQFTPPVGCVGTPVAGATAATSPTICFGSTTTLSLPTATSGAGISYQWQSSPDGIIPYSNITGATSSTYIAAPTSSTYFRCVVTCSSGPTSVNSTPIQINYTNNVLTTSAGVRCGTGTVNLAATGNAGSTLKWYTASSGGTAIGSGSPFITPSISTTTNYYVGAESTSTGIGSIGTGTSVTSAYGYPTAFGNYWYQDWQQIVYTAAELSAAGLTAGNITALAMNITGLPSPTSISGYTIKIASTASTTLSGFTTTGLTNVYGPSSITPVAGWNTITFGTPFYWDGTSNIIVDIREDGVYGSANATTQYTTTTGNTCVYAYSGSSAPGTFFTSSPAATTSTSRPNIRFTGSIVCSSPRVSVTATVNTTPVVTVTATTPIMCVGYTTALTATATPAAVTPTTTYTWAPTAGLYSDAACTIPYTGAVTSTVYYKSTTPGSVTYTATGTNSVGNCVGTGSATLTINATPTVSITPIGSTTVCADSGVMMRSTYTGTGLSFQWFNGTTALTGATNDSLFANAISGAGNYTLKVSLGSCSATSNISTLVLNPLPTPLITPAGKLNVCSDVTTVLTGSGTGTYQWFNTSGPIPGATGSTITASTVTGPSYYGLLIVDPITGCRKSTVYDTVIVTPKPTVSIAPVASTSICADSFQVLTSVHSSGYGTGNTYQWYNGTTPVRTNDTLRVNAIPGVYTLKVTNNGLCSTTSNAATIVVNPLPAASFTKTGPNNAICVGGTRELTALTIPASSNYQWMLNGVVIAGATSQIYNAPVAGIYTVRITDFNNCRKFSDTMSLFMSPLGIPDLSPKDLRFCQGTNITLYSNADPSAISYLWTRNGVSITDTTRNIVTGLSGTYDVTCKDIYGCIQTSTKSTIIVDPLPSKPVITKVGMVLSTTTSYTTYQWYRNGKLIPGATSRSYAITFDGNYSVVVTNSAGCVNTSDVMSLQNLAIQNVSGTNINVAVYPNPTQSIVNIDAPVAVNVTVQDALGKKVFEMNHAKQVDMSSFADGMYIFTITNEEGIIVKMDKVVKRTN